MSRFLAERDRRLSETLRITALYFRNFCFAQTDTFKFMLNTFRMHALIQLKCCELHFEFMALRNLVCAVLST